MPTNVTQRFSRKHSSHHLLRGYNPLSEARTLSAPLVRHRTSLGLTQREAERRIGVDPDMLARWERGEREPDGVLLEHVKAFLAGHYRRRWVGRISAIDESQRRWLNTGCFIAPVDKRVDR